MNFQNLRCFIVCITAECCLKHYIERNCGYVFHWAFEKVLWDMKFKLYFNTNLSCFVVRHKIKKK